MCIGAGLLCQAYIAPFSFFLALMHHLCWISKTLQEPVDLILTMNLVMQRLRKRLERKRAVGEVPAQVKMLWLITQKALDQLYGSVGPPLNLETIGKQALASARLHYEFHRVAFLKLFSFSSPLDKVPRTTASRDDAGWDQESLPP